MAVKQGDRAPDFELEGTDGTFRLSDHRGTRVVLLFYPGDFTPTCTKQFCSYAERSEEFDELDAVVVGISAQDVNRHAEFKAMHGIPVPLLADTDKSVAKAYGVSAPILGTRRAVIVVDEEGRIAHHFVHTLGLAYESLDEIKAVLDELPARA